MYRDKNRHSLVFELFGKSPKTRLIDLFLSNSLFEFTRKELVESLGMAKVTLYPTVNELERQGIVKITRKIGKTNLYRLNTDSETVKQITVLIRTQSLRNAELEDAPIMLEEETARLGN